MKGRKPVPTALKIARGNPGKRRLSDDEPQPSRAVDLALPAILADDADARRAWTTLAPLLHRLGLLTEVDRDALMLYCATFAQWQQATRHIQQHGMLLKIGKRKLPVLNPHLGIATKAQSQCRAMLIEFGLTPVSRSRVHVPPADAPNAQRDRFFGPIPVRPKPA